MQKYFWHNILIYGSDHSTGEKWVAGIILLAIFILTAWLDPV